VLLAIEQRKTTNQSMIESKAVRSVVLTNPQGLHLRPAELFVKRAAQFQSKIEIVKENLRVDGKSILNIITLVATEGTPLILEATGPDAESAIEALAELIERNFAEEEPNEN
jgi:phosphotransferase system HPr (HPr) family protein